MVELDFTVGSLTVNIIIGITTILVLYLYGTRNHSYWKNKGIPCVKSYPFLGSLYELMTKRFQDVELQRYFKYGKLYGNYEGNSVVLSVGDPALLRDIFVKDFQYFPGRAFTSFGDEIISKMLFSVTGEDWKRIRAIVSPTFTSGKIKKTFSIFKDCTSTAVENFKVYAEKGEPVELKRVYGCYTMDVIASSAFSTKIDSHNSPQNEFVKQAKIAFAENTGWRTAGYILFPAVWKFFKVSPTSPSAINFFSSMISQIVEERRKTDQTRNDFLQLLLDSAKETEENMDLGSTDNDSEDIAENYGKDDAAEYILKNKNSKRHLSFNELVAQCVIFFIAGYESTASTLSFATYLLALNQDAQDKARAEVDQAIKDNSGNLTYDAIQSMKYLDNVISETLRLYAPGIRTDRVANKDYKLGEMGLTLNKGVIVTIPAYAIHRDPEYYPDPEKFDPDRFSPEERAKRNPYTYLPFGLGPRNCVAMRFALIEVKVALAYVISNFIIKRCPQTKVPLEFEVGVGILRAKDIMVSMELRKERSRIK